MTSTNFNLVQVKITCLVYSNSLVSISNLVPLKSITHKIQWTFQKKPVHGTVLQMEAYLNMDPTFQLLTTRLQPQLYCS